VDCLEEFANVHLGREGAGFIQKIEKKKILAIVADYAKHRKAFEVVMKPV
jgi:hypothetical protein